jgi:DnaJ-class molecular chaperone
MVIVNCDDIVAYCFLPWKKWQAMLGGKVEVPTLDGTAEVKVTN